MEIMAVSKAAPAEGGAISEARRTIKIVRRPQEKRKKKERIQIDDTQRKREETPAAQLHNQRTAPAENFR